METPRSPTATVYAVVGELSETHNSPPSSPIPQVAQETHSASQSEQETGVLINVSELDSVPAAENNEPFKRYDITYRCRHESMYSIETLLSRGDVRACMKRIMPNLEWLTRFKFNRVFIKNLIDLLIQRRVNSPPVDHELWFNFDGLLVRFSIREFVLCSGLSVHRVHTSEEESRRMKDLELIRRVYKVEDSQEVYKKRFPAGVLEQHLLQIHADNVDAGEGGWIDMQSLENFTKLIVALTLTKLMFDIDGHNMIPARVIQLCNDASFCDKYNCQSMN